MAWNNQEIERHKEAAKLLYVVKEKTFQYIARHPEVTEGEVHAFIVKQFHLLGLKTNFFSLIVAFGDSAATPHYRPWKSIKTLRKETLILLDIWGRLEENRSPYADITWMGYYGNSVSSEIQKVVDAVFQARDAGIKFLEQQLRLGNIPSGKSVDLATYDLISSGIYKDQILHRTGHSLGFHHPHGKYPPVSLKNELPLLKNIGYTIEPGLYFKNRFGVRTEIDLYFDDKLKLVVTTPIQKELEIISA